MRPVIDAGPSLNFLAARAERVLFGTLGKLCAPEVVRDEVLRKAERERRFSPAHALWRKLEPGWIEVLSDDATPYLSAAVERIASLPVRGRAPTRLDPGETMVIAHAVVAAEAGESVTVLIDEWRGAQAAGLEARRLDRLRATVQSVGILTVTGTPGVLAAAAGSEHIPDRGAMRALYERMRRLDDGLVHIDQTQLLSAEIWSPATED